MSTSSKILPGETLGEVEKWELPEVGGGPTRPKGMLTARELEALQKRAWQEGFAKGKQDGVQAGQKEIQQRVRHLEQLMQALATPFHELDEEIERELVNLAMDMTRQLVRREIHADPGQVIAVVREAIAALPLTQRKISLYLHPEDAAQVRQALSPGEQDQAWVIVEDPSLSRGGCRVTTEYSQVDATVDTRLAAIFARVMGGERDSDHDDS